MLTEPLGFAGIYRAKPAQRDGAKRNRAGACQLGKVGEETSVHKNARRHYMKIMESATSTFWKGEQGIQASVQDGDRLYKVNLYVKGSQVRDYSCSCVNGKFLQGHVRPCKACVGTMEKRTGAAFRPPCLYITGDPHHDPGVYQPGSGKDHRGF